MPSDASAAPGCRETAPPRLIVVTGPSGVGKSSLALALQEELLPEQWLHFSVDTLFYALPRSVVERVDRHGDWSLVDSNAIVGSAQACVRTLLDRGHRVIFDAVVLSETGARRLHDAFSGDGPLVVELACAWDEVRRRTLARGDRTLAEAEHGHRNAGGHVRAHLRLDSTHQSPRQLAAQLAMHVRGGSGAG